VCWRFASKGFIGFTTTQAGKPRPVFIFFLLPLVPVAGLLFLLGAERLERSYQDAGLRTFDRSSSALGDTVARAREAS